MTPEKAAEPVICLPADVATDVCPKPFTPAVSTNIYELIRAVRLHGTVRTRDRCENDRYQKHLCTYVFVYDRIHAGFVTYSRGGSGSEARLHGLRSAGFGGHINASTDFSLSELHELNDYDRARVSFQAAAVREVGEELQGVNFGSLRYAGLISDDSNDVGKVHLGLAYVMRATVTEPTSQERDQKDLRVEKIKDIDLSKMETWSQIGLEWLKGHL